MEDNLYSAPKAEVREPAEKAEKTGVPPEIEKDIRYGVIAGCFSFATTLVLTLLSLIGISIMGFSAWEFFDVAFVGGLTFGTYKKSRVCAALLVAYYVISKILIYTTTGKLSGGLFAIVLLYCFARGLSGTIAYHRWKNAD